MANSVHDYLREWEIFTNTDSYKEENDDKNFAQLRNQRLDDNAVQYTALLKVYVENTKKNLHSKYLFKIWYFIISLVVIAVSIWFSFYTMNNVLISNLATQNKLLQLIPSLTTFIVPLYIIPRTITKYLFNNKNEEDMIDILKTIIQHDEHTLTRIDSDVDETL